MDYLLAGLMGFLICGWIALATIESQEIATQQTVNGVVLWKHDNSYMQCNVWEVPSE